MKSWLTVSLILALNPSWFRSGVVLLAPVIVSGVDFFQSKGLGRSLESQLSLGLLLVTSLCYYWAKKVHTTACPEALKCLDKIKRQKMLLTFRNETAAIAERVEGDLAFKLRRKLIRKVRLLGCFSSKEEAAVVDSFCEAAAEARERGEELSILKQSLSEVEQRLNAQFPRAQRLCLILLLLYLVGLLTNYVILICRCFF